MGYNRRQLMQLIGISGLGLATLPMMASTLTPKTKLNVLVLGGTNFLGPAIVKAFRSQGHAVTLFNRGITNPQLFPGLNKIRGDRDQGLPGYAAVNAQNEHWDVVVDVWTQNPNHVEEAIQVLKHKTKHYMFVSSVAVYKNFVSPNMDESAPLRSGTEYQPNNYNLNKVLCEKVVTEHFPKNFTIYRPGGIVGDRDPGPFGTDLLSRIMNREQILAVDADDPVQLIDAQDIGEFACKCAEQKKTGYYNLVGPAVKMTYKEMITGAKQALNSQVDIVWVPPEFILEDAKLEPFIQIPYWIPIKSDPEPGFYQINNSKALAAGLKFTRYAKTVLRSYDSFKAKRFIPESESIFGISDSKEAEIIKMWQQKTKA